MVRHLSWTTLTLALAIAACSTVQTRREDPPILDVATEKTLAEFQACFAEQIADEDIPTYTPRGSGGTYTRTIGNDLNRYVVWLVDIDDLGDRRQVRVFAVDSVGGPNRDIMRKVSSCI